MTKENEMSNTFSELNEIFKYLETDILEKIPKNLRDNINQYKNNDYKFKYDTTKELQDQNISTETKNLLAAIYIIYCCDKEKKEKILAQCKQNDIDLKHQQEKYSYDNLFKNKTVKQSEENKTENTMALTEIKKDNWITKFIKKIKQFFSFRKER